MTVKVCVDCGGTFPAAREFDYCVPCSARRELPSSPRRPADAVVYVLSASGFKNNGAELVRVEQHFENQQHNHVRG